MDAGAGPLSGAEAAEPPFGQVAIVGCGLIGGSMALAAKSRWPQLRVVAVDRAAVVATALAAGVVDGGSENIALVADADLVVLAAPVRANIDALSALGAALSPGCLVSDVGSTKRRIVDAAAEAQVTFVGGHPLAGAARGGIGGARGDLFAGRPWVLTPAPTVPEPTVSRLERFVSGLGARPRRMTADAHDQLLAYLSHLPQLAVSALMAVVGDHAGPEGLALAGPGLRDSTRLAASPPDIWRDVVGTNADHVAAAIDALIAALERLRPGGGDGRQIDATFADAARWREVLGG